MQNAILKSILITIGLSLAACTTNYNQATQTPAPSTNQAEKGTGESVKGPVGGPLLSTMDSFDKEKLSHALDNPLGKSSHWVNQSNGMAYTVVPTEKVTVGNNNFCRKYNVTATKNGNKQTVNGTACVEATTGSWQAIQ